MALTDNELGMIEQLTYLNGSVAEEAGISGFSGVKSGQKNMTIAEILECFDEEALKRLEEKGDQDIGFVSAKEWAGIIRYLKNSKMKDLILVDTMTKSDGTTLALCFAETGNADDAIVAFKGTSGGDEWIDNVEGLNAEDTQCQKEALDFIESLPYGSITVTGHSKGGNKAMYVAIISDKVTRCVSYDGQGFSQEFIDKYWAEIQAKGGKITAYSLSTDFVHALLFPVPNSNQIYCQGYGVANIAENHSPNSFFMTDANGNIVVDGNGNPIIVQISEAESITMLHEFTTFVINNASNEDKEIIIGFVSKLLAMVFGGDQVSKDELIDYILGQDDALALVLAYLVKYMDEYDLDADDIDGLLETLGLNSLNKLKTLTDFDVLGYHVDVNLNLANILNYIKQQLTDGNDDKILKFLILPALKAVFAGDYEIDITAFWEKINSKVRDIDGSGGCGNAKAKSGTIRDFSSSVYDSLMNAISRIENLGGGSVSSWSSYSGEGWYSSLLVGIAIKGINGYFSKISETNQTCKAKIETVFNNVNTIDNTISARLVSRCQELQGANTYITSMANNIVS
ncbi:DUF2974 domain-containing protein [Pseudoflavonifractor sp. SW1122]|uniref:Mbeg1-like protein n=1 Tax=Pseudoflavonifractor sp. SW1122 TaxID=2530044 RepID=UPI0014392FE2|nr:Mbeg1-like protein [Pseudoflavonifractor sp. SW1122]NJE73937.1 DUF2974 domain-containing protein [Pseudoflavonifractor sp. SW1122]